MSTSQSMTVARRLSLGFGLIILVLAAMVAVSLIGLNTINQKIHEIIDVTSPQGTLASRMVDASQEIRVQYRQLLLDSDPALKKNSLASLAKAREAFLKNEGDLKASIQKYAEYSTATGRDLILQVSNQRAVAFVSVDRLIDLDTQNKEAEALTELNTMTSPSMAKLNHILRDLTTEVDRLNDVAGAAAETAASSTRWQMVETTMR